MESETKGLTGMLAYFESFERQRIKITTTRGTYFEGDLIFVNTLGIALVVMTSETQHQMTFLPWSGVCSATFPKTK